SDREDARCPRLLRRRNHLPSVSLLVEEFATRPRSPDEHRVVHEVPVFKSVVIPPFAPVLHHFDSQRRVLVMNEPQPGFDYEERHDNRRPHEARLGHDTSPRVHGTPPSRRRLVTTATPYPLKVTKPSNGSCVTAVPWPSILNSVEPSGRPNMSASLYVATSSLT